MPSFQLKYSVLSAAIVVFCVNGFGSNVNIVLDDASTAEVSSGSVDQEIIMVTADHLGGGPPHDATFTAMNFTSTCNNDADVLNAKLYYTTSTTFATTTQLGATDNDISNGINFSFSQAITRGSTGYFWLTFDLAPSPLGCAKVGASQIQADITVDETIGTYTDNLTGGRVLPGSSCVFVKAFGGTGVDMLFNPIKKSDGYWFGGQSASYSNGFADGWIIKTDFGGNLLWNKTYGGVSDDNFGILMELADGNNLVSGRTRSWGAGLVDVWVIKLDNTGAIIWETIFGAAGEEYIYGAVELADGSFVLAGRTDSYGSGTDLWIVKLSSTGTILWQNYYGGTGFDSGNNLVELPGGDLMTVMRSTSYGNGDQCIIMRISTVDGTVVWAKDYGGTGTENARDIKLSNDGNVYILTWSDSYGAGGYDAILTKMDYSGTVLWEKSYGGATDESPTFIDEDASGNLWMSMRSTSFGAGLEDIMILKLDGSGNLLDEYVWGGALNDYSYDVLVDDDEFVFTGYTKSIGGTDEDGYIARTDKDGTIGCWKNSSSITVGTPSVSIGTQSIGATATSWAIATSTATPTDRNPTVITECLRPKDGAYVTVTDANPGDVSGGSTNQEILKIEVKHWGGESAHNLTITGINMTPVNSDNSEVTAAKLFYTTTPIFATTTQLGADDTNLGDGISFSFSQNIGQNGNGYFWLSYDISATVEGCHKFHASITSANFTANEKLVTFTDSTTNGRITDCNYFKTIGESGNELSNCIFEDSFGNLILGSRTTSEGAGSEDFSIIKLNSAGEILWETQIGGASLDYGLVSQEDNAGNYFIGGWTNSYGAGGFDMMVSKVNSAGTVLWTKAYGGASDENLHDMINTRDGSIVLVGSTKSYGAGQEDAMLIKIDGSGNEVWSNVYGGTSDEFFYSGICDAGNNLVLAGKTMNFGAQGEDVFVVKTDGTGAVLWEYLTGGTGQEIGWGITEYAGDYLIAANTYSYGAGSGDAWIVKINNSGSILWDTYLGGSSGDVLSAIGVNSTGDCYGIGRTASFGAGGEDVMITKLNVSGVVQWTSVIGGSSTESAQSGIVASNGQVIFTGYTQSFGLGGDEAIIGRLKSDGSLSCNQSFPSPTSGTASETLSATSATVSSPIITVTSPSPTVTSPGSLLMQVICTTENLKVYWMSNGGNWNDHTHWSFSSGGNTGFCLPEQPFNTIFDANSFTGPGQVITIPTGTWNAKTLDFQDPTTQPILKGIGSLIISQ